MRSAKGCVPNPQPGRSGRLILERRVNALKARQFSWWGSSLRDSRSWVDDQKLAIPGCSYDNTAPVNQFLYSISALHISRMGPLNR